MNKPKSSIACLFCKTQLKHGPSSSLHHTFVRYSIVFSTFCPFSKSLDKVLEKCVSVVVYHKKYPKCWISYIKFIIKAWKLNDTPVTLPRGDHPPNDQVRRALVREATKRTKGKSERAEETHSSDGLALQKNTRSPLAKGILETQQAWKKVDFFGLGIKHFVWWTLRTPFPNLSSHLKWSNEGCSTVFN